MASLTSASRPSEQDEILFKSWMAQHNRVYNTQQEYYERLQIFTENKRMIDKHNEENHSFTMGLNQFADMTLDEMKKSCCGCKPQN